MAHPPKSDEQKQRLAAALRENLKRRKARARALAEAGADRAAAASNGPEKAAKPD